MLRRVHPAVLFAAVAVVGFFAGDRVEMWLSGPARELRAEAAPLPRKLPPAKPLALRLPPPAPSAVAAATPAAVSATAPAIPAEASLPPAESAKAEAPQAPNPDDPEVKPSVVSGSDADTNVEFYEMKDLPETQDQGQESAHDVDMIDESNDAPKDAPADSTSDKKSSDN